MAQRSAWSVAAVLLLSLGADAANAQDRKDEAVRLQWKFEKDRPFFQESTITTKQHFIVMRQDIVQEQKQVHSLRFVPRDQDRAGQWRMAMKVLALKMDIDVGGNKPSVYYYTDPGPPPPNPLDEIVRKLGETEFQVTFGADLSVLKIDGREEFLERLKPSAAQAHVVKSLVSDASLKYMVSVGFVRLPMQPVRRGESWTGQNKLDLGPIGVYASSRKYTYEGLEENLDKISIATALHWAPSAKAESDLPFTIKKGSFKSTSGGGSIHFDRARGWVVRCVESQRLVGQLTIEVGGLETVVDLDQSQTITVRTTDAEPGKK